MDKLLKLERAIAKIEISIAGSMIVLALCISLYTIVWRNLDYSTGDWVLELPITLVSWAIFIGVGANIALDKHIYTDFFVKRFHERTRAIISILVYLILVALFLSIFYYAIIATKSFIKTDYKLYEMFFTPFFIVFIIVPISSFIWCFHIIIKIVELGIHINKIKGTSG